MGFIVPDFNLTCDVYDGPYDTRALRLAGVECNLAMGRRVQVDFHDATGLGFGAGTAQLLVPAGTDIREVAQLAGGGPPYDIVEVPSGSGRWYVVNSVDDVAKGFPNEYRLAFLAKLSSNSGLANTTGLFWPIPMP